MYAIIKSKLNYSIHPTTLKTIKLKLLENGNGSLGLPTLQNLERERESVCVYVYVCMYVCMLRAIEKSVLPIQ